MTSIGELNEQSLHRALKERYAVAGSDTERAIDGFVADVVTGGRIVEIQTGGFGPLKGKLSRLLESYPVTLVHPIARDRYIVKAGDNPGCAGDAAQVTPARIGVRRLRRRSSASRRCSRTPT